MKGGLSLSLRIILVVSLVFVLLFGLVSFSNYLSVKHFSKESERQKSVLLLDAISPVVAIDLYLGMNEALREYLQKIVRQNPMIASLAVHDATGKVIYDYRIPSYEAMTGEPIRISRELTTPNSQEMTGVVELIYSGENYEHLLHSYRHYILYTFLVAVLLLTLLLWWLKNMLAPLKDLADEVRAYDPKKGNFPKEKSPYNDEIGIIRNAMVEMFEKIEAYTNRLFELTLKLETKVKERTESLETANKLLRQEIIERARAEEQLKYANRKLEELSTRDPLTDLYNRRAFEQNLKHFWKMAKRDKKPLSLLLCDIDYFKKINDTFGHPAGDECLQELATILRKSVRRPLDMVARYGGEEFIFLLPDTPSEGALQVAEEIQRHIAERNGMTTTQIPFTVSIGVATMVPDDGLTYHDLIKAADLALYEAKHRGRNRIECHNLW